MPFTTWTTEFVSSTQLKTCFEQFSESSIQMLTHPVIFSYGYIFCVTLFYWTFTNKVVPWESQHGGNLWEVAAAASLALVHLCYRAGVYKRQQSASFEGIKWVMNQGWFLSSIKPPITSPINRSVVWFVKCQKTVKKCPSHLEAHVMSSKYLFCQNNSADVFFRYSLDRHSA